MNKVTLDYDVIASNKDPRGRRKRSDFRDVNKVRGEQVSWTATNLGSMVDPKSRNLTGVRAWYNEYPFSFNSSNDLCNYFQFSMIYDRAEYWKATHINYWTVEREIKSSVIYLEENIIKIALIKTPRGCKWVKCC